MVKAYLNLKTQTECLAVSSCCGCIHSFFIRIFSFIITWSSDELYTFYPSLFHTLASFTLGLCTPMQLGIIEQSRTEPVWIAPGFTIPTDPVLANIVGAQPEGAIYMPWMKFNRMLRQVDILLPAECDLVKAIKLHTRELKLGGEFTDALL